MHTESGCAPQSPGPSHSTPQPPASQTSVTLRLAMDLHAKGNFSQAEALYQFLLEQNPCHLPVLHLLGVLAVQRNESERALWLFTRAVEIDPMQHGAHCNRGLALVRLERWEAAVSSYDAALALRPGEASIHAFRGAALKALKCWGAALASYDRAIALEPNSHETHADRGIVLIELGELTAALDSYNRAITLKPDFAEAYSNRGALYQRLEDPESALASFNRAIEFNPAHAHAHCNRGIVLQLLGQPEAALASFDRAIAVSPMFARFHFNRGNALHAVGRLEEAVAGYSRALALEGNHTESYLNRGNVLRRLGRQRQALADYERAIAANPYLAESYMAKAMALLLLGDLANGFKLYEWRWKQRDCTRNIAAARDLNRPLWLGEPILAGKSILVHDEQGLGDAIQYCRYLPWLAELGAEVVLETPKPLLSLLKQQPGVERVVELGQPLPLTDYHCPLMSLSLAFGTQLDSIPSSLRYLKAETSKVEQWRTRLQQCGGPRVGLVWSGNPEHRHDRSRSIPLAQLLAHLPPGFQYVSLQKELRAGDELLLRARPQIQDYRDRLIDFSETAALCECLDLVIAVDTSVAHLSCALGKQTWILLAFDPDWRWMLERSDSPWYPTARLYRQTERDAWADVLERVRVDLTRTLAPTSTE